MMTEYYFFDTYALIEIFNGNKNYERFLDSVIVTSKLNLFELFYIISRDVNNRLANFLLERYYKFAIDFGPETIENAAKFRLENKPKFSMADCIGYKTAEFLGIKFLTGDDGFNGLSNVEFVK